MAHGLGGEQQGSAGAAEQVGAGDGMSACAGGKLNSREAILCRGRMHRLGLGCSALIPHTPSTRALECRILHM